MFCHYIYNYNQILFLLLLLEPFTLKIHGSSDDAPNNGGEDPSSSSSSGDSDIILPIVLVPNDSYQKDSNRCDFDFCPFKDYGPHSPYVPCDHLPMDFIECDELIDHQGNQTSYQLSGELGCLKFQGGQQGIYFGASRCHVLESIQCYGKRGFIRRDLPCVKYNGHYFITALLFSLLLGFLGMDRFYLGHIGTAIGKLLTIGGVGIWWIVDVVLLITGNLMPEDGSNWMPYV